MNKYELRKQFGRRPTLAAIMVWAVQQALRPFGRRHPDYKRQRTARKRSQERRVARAWKEGR